MNFSDERSVVVFCYLLSFFVNFVMRQLPTEFYFAPCKLYGL